MQKNSHCSYCGQAFAAQQPWPRQCAGCGQMSFVNPLPVVVVLLPVGAGLLVIRRSIPPHVGALALPGGFIDLGETWQQAGAREVLEETGMVISPDELRVLDVHSAPDDTLIIFARAQPHSLADLPPFAANAETSACVILTQPAPLAWELHTRYARRFFEQAGSPQAPRTSSGPHKMA